MIIIFHFNFLLNLIFERKKVADKNYHRLNWIKKSVRIKTRLKAILLRTDSISEYEVVKVQYLKICTTK